MSKDSVSGKKPKPSRFTLAPLYLAAGLAVCYFVLTGLLPALRDVLDEKSDRKVADWSRYAFELSTWSREHARGLMTVLITIGLAGFVVPLVIRPLRFVVWLMALAVFVFVVALVAAGYGGALMRLLHEAGS